MWPSSVFSQIDFEKYQVEDGLSQNSILALLQDRNGYIWIGTEDGLNRFDGYSFKKFFQHGNDSVGLYNDYIWSLLESKDGKIWIGHSNGVSYYDPEVNRFKNVVIEDNLLIVSSYEDAHGDLWFGSAGKGLLKLNPTGNVVTYIVNNYPSQPPFDQDGWAYASNNILCITELNKKIVIGTRGAGMFEVSGEEVVRYGKNKFEPFLTANDIWSILSDKEGKIFIGSSLGLGISDVNFTNLKIFNTENTGGALSFNRIARLCFDKDEGLWIATYGGGLNHFDFSTEQFWNSRYKESDPQSLTNDLVFTLLVDRSENLWAGTWSGGLHKISKYASYIYSFDAKNGLADLILSINIRHDSVFVASYSDGIFFSKNGRMPFSSERPVFSSIPSPSGTYILDIDAGAKYLWMGLDGQGVLYTEKDLSNPKWKALQRIRGNPNSLNNHLVDAIKEDNNNTLWIGTRGSGLKRYFYRRPYGSPESIHQYTFRKDDSLSLSDDFILDIGIDKKNYLWVGTTNGLSRSRFPIQGDTLIDQFIRFGKGRIISIGINPDNDKYIGTDHGLYTIENEEWLEVEGFQNEFINSIVWDQSHNMWVSTNSGIYVVANNGVIRHFTSKDGLQSNEFNARSAAIDMEGMVYFGGIKGMNIIDPQLLEKPIQPSKIVISSIRINNKEEIFESKEIILDHNHRVVTFEFTLLDFVNPSANLYEYKLEGFDEEWVTTGSGQRIATYTNLDPGEYTFLVKGINSEGVNSNGSASIKIINLPPPWKTWWAYTSYLLLLATAAFVIIRTIVLRQRMKTKLAFDEIELKKLKELDEFKSSFFANISHEFRTPLTLILGQLDELEQEKKSENRNLIRSIRNNSKAALNLVNQLLDLSRVDSGKFTLQVGKIPVQSFFSRLLDPFIVLAHQKKLKFVTSFPDKDEIILADPSILEKVINNLISNAIKYNQPDGKINFSANVNNGTLRIEIRDTGIGIDEKNLPFIFDRFYRIADSVEGTGIGLAIAKELVLLHKGTINVKSKKGEGTQFIIELPCSQDAHPDYIGNNEIFTPNDQPFVKQDQVVMEDSEVEIHQGAPVLLVIEDNEDLMAYLKRNLAGQYEIILAHHGEEGVHKAKSQIPDIILCDWMMPGKSGIDVCKALKSDELTSHIPIVLLTARVDSNSRIEGLKTGADDYIAKPFDLTELKVRLLNLINQRNALREKYTRLGVAHYNHAKATSLDEKFISRLYEYIGQHLSDDSLSVEKLSHEMGVSRAQLHRKVTALTGHPASAIIREYRLERAADLLRQKSGNVSEIAFQVGFENLSYFTKAFKHKYKVTPSEFLLSSQSS